MNLFDLAALLLLAVSVILGFRSGALPQLGGLAGAVAGGALALLGLPAVEGILAELDPPARAITVVVGLLTLIAVGEGVGSTLGRAVGQGLGTGVLGALDRVSGSLVGAAQAVLIVWLAGGLLAAGPLRSLAVQAQTSVAVRALAVVMPPPTEIAVALGRMLDAYGLPEVFIGLEPLPAPPVDLPADPQARAIAEAASPSTFRVTAPACGAVSSGTSFAVAGDYLVTNAHVVAGSRSVRVAQPDRAVDAVTVLFDPDLDVAVLWATGLDAPVLRFAAEDPDRGATGVTLGFPNGAGLTTVPAAVAEAYDAQGRDIYGTRRVRRAILELRARVDRGDSGGPFVLANGTVGGVVFAEARTDEEVGYALAGRAVAERVEPAIGRTGQVDTGACLR